jgi:hypothetical protein
MTPVSLSSNLKSIGARIGFVFACGGAGVLLGQPVAGQILASTGSYFGLQCWTAAALTCSTILMLSARVAKTGMKLSVKA